MGAALGYIAGGQCAAEYGWRNLFLFSTIPGIILAGGFLLLAPESRRSEDGVKPPSFLTGVRLICDKRVLALAIIGYILNTFALNGVAMFVVRHVSGLGMVESEASKYFGINLAITGFIGAFFGGQLASRLVRASPTPVRGLLRFVGVTTLIGVPFLSASFLFESPFPFFAACFIAQIALFAGTAPLNAVLVARAPTGLEAFTQGITIFAIQLFGGALAPILIGAVADGFMSFAGLSSRGALSVALQFSSIAMIGSGAVWLLASKVEARDSRLGDGAPRQSA